VLPKFDPHDEWFDEESMLAAPSAPP